jgi:hypothetical protein
MRASLPAAFYGLLCGIERWKGRAWPVTWKLTSRAGQFRFDRARVVSIRYREIEKRLFMFTSLIRPMLSQSQVVIVIVPIVFPSVFVLR